MKQIFAYACTAGLLLACGPGPSVDIAFDSGPLTMGVDTPMTPGITTIQSEVVLNLDEQFEKAQAKRDEVQGVDKGSMVLTAPEGRNFDLFENLTISFYSDENNMTTVATLNPVEKGQSTLEIPLSDLAEIGPYFEENKFLIVLDAQIMEPDTLPFELNAQISGTLKPTKK